MMDLSFERVICLLSGFLLSGMTTLGLTHLVREWAVRHQVVDRPNHRSSHAVPTPRVGGIGIIGGFSVGMLYYWILDQVWADMQMFIQFPHPLILFGAFLMALTGLVDDLRGLRASQKLVAQSIVAAMVIFSGFKFNLGPLSPENAGLLGDILTYGITFVWIIGVINAVNLIDGLDGLAAGVSLIAITSLTAILAMQGYGPDIPFVATFIGALVGFLILNRHPASIFMGDTGSLFLGYMLATFALPATRAPEGVFPFLAPIVALALPITDTLMSIMRRVAQGKGLMDADKDHIHHRMGSRLGLSHGGTVVALWAISLYFGLTAVLLALANTLPLLTFGVAMTLALILFILIKLEYIIPTRD